MTSDSRLLEYVESGKLAADKVDREKCVVRGVKCLGERSKNPPPFNHIYPEPTRRGAHGLLEGLRVYVDHPAPDKASETRPYRDQNGFVFGPFEEHADGTYGNWQLNPKHVLTESILWDAANNPRGVAFSINGNSDHKRRTEEGQVVEKIDVLDSIDLVTRGATTNGLFESERKPMKKKLSTLIEELKTTRPGYAKALREMADSGVMSPDQSYDEPAPMGTGCGYPKGKGPTDEEGQAVDHEEALKQGFRGACGAVLDDDSMDMASKLKKLKEIMAAQEKLLGGGKGKGGKGPGQDDPANPDDPADNEAREGRRGGKNNLTERLARLEARDLVRRVADAAEVKVSEALLEAIRPNVTEGEVKALVEEFRKLQTAGGATPRPAGGARSAAGAGNGTGPGGTFLRESQQGGQTQGAPSAPAVPKFEGEKAQEARASWLRNTR